MYQPRENEIFHVHTKRCKHASEDEDFQYVEAAIRLGADRIVFTDHCPFPGDPFGQRMSMEQLPEYIDSIHALKKEYKKQIEVLCGLEAEYLPSYLSFYKELRASKDFDLLMIGQHLYENSDGSWSFHNEDKSEEHLGLCAAMVEGIQSGLFDVVAHPDRAFKRCKEWDSGMMGASYDIIMAATKHKIVLEKNYSSMQYEYQYWDPFWVRAAMAEAIYGYDAHSVKDMEDIWKKQHTHISQDEIVKLLGKG